MPELTRTQKTFLKVKEGKLYKVVNKEEVEIYAIMGKLKSIKFFEKDVEYKQQNTTVHIKGYEIDFYDDRGTWSWSADASSYTTLFFLNALAGLNNIESDIIFRPYLNKNKKTNIALEEDVKLIGDEYKGTLVRGKYEGDDIPQREPIMVKGKHYEIKGVKQWNWEPIETFNAKLVEEIVERLNHNEYGDSDSESNDDDDSDFVKNEIFANAEKAK